ncbi:Polysulfide reductase NrfD [mine drainage metagenome]|uniref:Polysulfide reductase NrfD n=1 Tax=mine drainage metagenome TaxID=410659 RepID=T1ACU0_9ZZZZ
MSAIHYREIEGHSGAFWALAGLLLVFIGAGLTAGYFMAHIGHIITGMTNQVVWGMPHVFAVFLIVAASGALNVPPPSPRCSAGLRTGRWRACPGSWPSRF